MLGRRRRTGAPGQRFRGGVVQLAGRGALLCIALTSSGCVPWTLGETAETLAPGRLGVGGGAAMLMPPLDTKETLPVGQLWGAVGVRDGLELRLDVVPVATAHAGAKLRVTQGSTWAAAVTGGAGYTGVPDLVGLGTSFWWPFLTAGAVASRRHDSLRPYVAVRGFMPFVLGDYPDAVLWVGGVAGVELGGGRWRWGPELGLVVPTSHPEDRLLQFAFSLRRR